MVFWWFWAFPTDMPKKWSKSAQKVVNKWPQQDKLPKILFWWFWAFPTDMPKKWSKSDQRVVKKWSRQDLGPFKHQICVGFLGNREAKVGVAAEVRRAHFCVAAEGCHPYLSTPQENWCLNGPRSCWDHFFFGSPLQFVWQFFEYIICAQSHWNTSFPYVAL